MFLFFTQCTKATMSYLVNLLTAPAELWPIFYDLCFPGNFDSKITDKGKQSQGNGYFYLYVFIYYKATYETVTVEPRYNEGSRDQQNVVRYMEISLYRGSFPYMLPLPGRRMCFVKSRTWLYRGSFNRGFTVFLDISDHKQPSCSQCGDQ